MQEKMTFNLYFKSLFNHLLSWLKEISGKHLKYLRGSQLACGLACVVEKPGRETICKWRAEAWNLLISLLHPAALMKAHEVYHEDLVPGV